MEEETIENSPIQNIIEPLYYGRGWIKFLGILMIISGVIQIFTLIGILVCWIPIWMGVILVKTAEFIGIAYEQDSEGDATVASNHLRQFFKISGIISILYLILVLLGLTIATTTSLFSAIQESGVAG